MGSILSIAGVGNILMKKWFVSQEFFIRFTNQSVGKIFQNQSMEKLYVIGSILVILLGLSLVAWGLLP